MKNAVTKFLSRVLLLVCMIGTAPQAARAASGGKQVGQFRGYFTVEAILRDQIFERSDTQFFELYRFLGYTYVHIKTLLGSFDEGVFMAGDPNAFNMYLWDNLWSKTAEQVSLVCNPQSDIPRVFPIRSSFEPLVLDLCRDSQTPSLQEIWIQLVGFGASQEFEAWRNALDEYGITSINDPQKRVMLVFYTLFLNPYFMLES